MEDLVRKGYSCFRADDTCMDRRITDLFEEHRDHNGACTDVPLILAYGFSTEEMRELISSADDNEVIFAAVTKVNAAWTLAELICEVSKENRVFRLQCDLREVLQVLSILAKRDPRLMENETFREMCTGAYMYLKKDGSDEEVLKGMVSVLRMTAVNLQGE